MKDDFSTQNLPRPRPNLYSDQCICDGCVRYRAIATKANELRAKHSDDVDHPSHYTRSSIECIDAIEAMVAGWPSDTAYRLGNVLKYLWRHRDKSPIESLRKAKWYLEREIERLEKTK